MTLQENIVKFSKVVKANPEKMNANAIRETARSIIVSDISHIGEDPRGRYEHLSLGGLAESGVAEFSTVCAGGSKKHDKVSDVMLMRIMCDVITLILNGDQTLAMKYSSEVSKAMGQRKRVSTGSYMEFAECERVLDYYLEKLGGFDEALKPVFERTVLYLAEMKRLQPKLDKYCVAITKTSMQKVWLPKEFESSGFDVSTTIPKALDGVPGDIVNIVTCYNFGFVLDAMIKAIVRDGKGEVAQWAFLNRLQDISSMSPQAFPVGTGVVPGIREEVYIPYHFLNNQALRVVYGKHFDKGKAISITDVDAFFQAVKTWLGVA